MNGHATLPADPLAIAAYLAERVAAAATVRTIRAAIRAGHVDTGADDPTGHESLACDDDADEEAPRRARHRGGSSAIDGPVHDGGLTTADQRQANSRAYLRAAARLTAKRERWQADRARAAPGEAKRARRRVRRVVRRAA